MEGQTDARAPLLINSLRFTLSGEPDGRNLRATEPGFGRMADEKKELPAGDLLKNSSLYREFQAERDEILKHKWIESEKAGHDIGFERALTDWIVKHRSKWRKARQTANQ